METHNLGKLTNYYGSMGKLSANQESVACPSWKRESQRAWMILFSSSFWSSSGDFSVDDVRYPVPDNQDVSPRVWNTMAADSG